MTMQNHYFPETNNMIFDRPARSNLTKSKENSFNSKECKIELILLKQNKLWFWKIFILKFCLVVLPFCHKINLGLPYFYCKTTIKKVLLVVIH